MSDSFAYVCERAHWSSCHFLHHVTVPRILTAHKQAFRQVQRKLCCQQSEQCQDSVELDGGQKDIVLSLLPLGTNSVMYQAQPNYCLDATNSAHDCNRRCFQNGPRYARLHQIHLSSIREMIVLPDWKTLFCFPNVFQMCSKQTNKFGNVFWMASTCLKYNKYAR